MINLLQDANDIEYYCLISDYSIRKTRPFYLIKTLGNKYTEHLQKPALLLAHIAILRREFDQDWDELARRMLIWLDYLQSAILLNRSFEPNSEIPNYDQLSPF